MGDFWWRTNGRKRNLVNPVDASERPPDIRELGPGATVYWDEGSDDDEVPVEGTIVAFSDEEYVVCRRGDGGGNVLVPFDALRTTQTRHAPPRRLVLGARSGGF